MPTIFTPLNYKKLSFKNRIFMAPLTRNRALPCGTLPEAAVTYYTQRAEAGLIISEATQISPMGKGYFNTPGIYLPQHIAAWRNVTNSVHRKNGKIYCQLWHVGRISHRSLLPNYTHPLAPSAITAKAQTYTASGMCDVSEPQEMSISQIKQTIHDYKIAASCAKMAGFDGIEIHAANGYLLNQFLCSATNKRKDEYGGSLEKQFKMVEQVLEAVLSVFEPHQVGIRLSPTGVFNDIHEADPLETYGYYLDEIADCDLGYVHFVEKFPNISATQQEINIIKQLRQKINTLYIANGDYDKQSANQAVASYYADAISLGRKFIANPDLVTRFALDEILNEPDYKTFYGGDEKGYTDYPFLPSKKNNQVA